MIVTGNKYAELAMLMDGRKFETIPFEAHPQVQEKIINSTFDFNQRVLQGLDLMTKGMPDDELIHALSEIQPAPEDNEAFNDYMSERHKRRINEKKIHVTPVVLEAARLYKRILNQLKEIEYAKLETTGIIKNYMESNSASVVDMGDNGQITWRKQLNVNYKEVNDGKNNLGF
jgi:predicted phage-related endonuclease